MAAEGTVDIPIQVTISLVATDTTITSWFGYLTAANATFEVVGTRGYSDFYNSATGWDTTFDWVPLWTGTPSKIMLGGVATHPGYASLGPLLSVRVYPTQTGCVTLVMNDLVFGTDWNGTEYPGTINILPEPATLLLLALGGLTASCRGQTARAGRGRPPGRLRGVCLSWRDMHRAIAGEYPSAERQQRHAI